MDLVIAKVKTAINKMFDTCKRNVSVNLHFFMQFMLLVIYWEMHSATYICSKYLDLKILF
jgi:hypothetical protein